MVNHPILGEGEPRGGAYQSVTDTKWRGEGAVVSHPFLGGGEPRGGGVPVCNRHQVEGRGGSGESFSGGVIVIKTHSRSI